MVEVVNVSEELMSYTETKVIWGTVKETLDPMKTLKMRSGK